MKKPGLDLFALIGAKEVGEEAVWGFEPFVTRIDQAALERAVELFCRQNMEKGMDGSAEFDIDAHFARFEAGLAAFLKIWQMDVAIGLSAEDLAESAMSHFAGVGVVVGRVKAESRDMHERHRGESGAER